MSMHISSTNRRLVGAAGLVAAGLLLAACGGGAGYGSASGSSTSPKTTQAAQGAVGQSVHTGKTDFGKVLVDSNGKTLYAFAADSPGKSNCTDTCLQYWPAAKASGTVSHSSDVTAKLATIERTDGTTQLTVNGWPAYTYAADSGPGQATGQGKNLSGGLWWVIAPSGAQIKSDAGGAGGGY
jgi:predicted lipoprotein with Yx(FWY)xxD motif